MTRSRLLLSSTLLLLTVLCLPLRAAGRPVRPPDRSYRIVGYVSRWTNIEGIDATKVTHLNYAFAQVRGDDTVFLEEPEAPASLLRLRELKRINPRLKVLLAIGGWGAEWFSDAALSDESRCRFVTSAAALMQEHDLDGLDIDWEYPGQRGAGNRFRPQDKTNFTLLLKDLRQELDLLSKARGRKGSDPYTLSIASSGGRYFQFTEMATLHPYLDWFNVMTYDFVDGGEPATGHHAALSANGPKSMEGFVEQHLAAGIPPEKIVVGVPLYGKMWRWVNRKSATGINEPYDLFGGSIPYADLQRDVLNDPRYLHGWDAVAKAPYLWDRELGTFVSYDDAQSMAGKARFVKAHHLGGVMYWQHRYDPAQSLLTTLYTTLRGK